MGGSEALSMLLNGAALENLEILENAEGRARHATALNRH
jgi:hypothetical protein